MNCQVGEIIVIDGKNNMVLTNLEDNGVYYSFINELKDDLSDITSIYYLVKHLHNNAYERVNDESEINRLYPKIQIGLQDSMKANGIDVDELKRLLEEEGAI